MADTLGPETLRKWANDGDCPIDGIDMAAVWEDEREKHRALVSQVDGRLAALEPKLDSIDTNTNELIARLAAAQRRVEQLEGALCQKGRDGAVGRIYPAHLIAWAKATRAEQHYDSALTWWLERLGTEWAALAQEQRPGTS